MTEQRRSLHGIDESPNIICHTDYFYSHLQLDDEILYTDNRTTVKVVEKIPLEIVSEANFHYIIDPEYVVFPEKAPRESKVFLLNLEVTSCELGQFSASVFFFVLENYNFLKEILLKHKIPISHFVKIREGCSFGGNRNSITMFYSLLGNLSVNYLLVDNEIHYNRKIHDEISSRFQIDHNSFKLKMLNIISSWSGFSTKIFKVIPCEGKLTQSDMDEILREISGKNQINYV
jgi:hypothetical protein